MSVKSECKYLGSRPVRPLRKIKDIGGGVDFVKEQYCLKDKMDRYGCPNDCEWFEEKE